MAREQRVPRVILLENHGVIALGSTAREVLNITTMLVKVCRILAGSSRPVDRAFSTRRTSSGSTSGPMNSRGGRTFQVRREAGVFREASGEAVVQVRDLSAELSRTVQTSSCPVFGTCADVSKHLNS